MEIARIGAMVLFYLGVKRTLRGVRGDLLPPSSVISSTRGRAKGHTRWPFRAPKARWSAGAARTMASDGARRRARLGNFISLFNSLNIAILVNILYNITLVCYIIL